MSGKEVKIVWFGEWERKAEHYLKLAKDAESKGYIISAREYYTMCARCYYAGYMINTDDIEQKRNVYNKLNIYYRKAVSLRPNRVEYVEISVKSGVLPAYLHFPDDCSLQKTYPCVMTYSGYGSCKEELDILAQPLIERGIAVLTVDCPGTDSALFDYDLKCDGYSLENAFNAMHDYLISRHDIDSESLANYGLCMGGGYAFHSSAKYTDIKCCVSLFPLFLHLADLNSVPIWMRRGKWVVMQTETNEEEYLSSMKLLESSRGFV